MNALRHLIRHETVYSYGGDVAHSHQLLHLSPRDFEHQVCRSRLIHLNPEPGVQREELDAFGNLATRLEYDTPHDRLEVTAELQVEVRARPAAPARDSDAWEAVREALTYSGQAPQPEYLEACRFRMESAHVKTKHAFIEYGAPSFAPGVPVLVAAEELMRRMYREFTYAPGATNIRTSALEALEKRRGVCQDYAHVMIGCLRSRGLAARYVSGYLRTQPPSAGTPPYIGNDASHAWVSVFCPPLGWIDLDPTNDLRVSTDHITIAWGRDFGDVSPLRGVIVGGGQHSLSVRVQVHTE
jgi:transglutaminase-like putative cysteine protease